jgi:hypothetical protein
LTGKRQQLHKHSANPGCIWSIIDAIKRNPTSHKSRCDSANQSRPEPLRELKKMSIRPTAIEIGLADDGIDEELPGPARVAAIRSIDGEQEKENNRDNQHLTVTAERVRLVTSIRSNS